MNLKTVSNEFRENFENDVNLYLKDGYRVQNSGCFLVPSTQLLPTHERWWATLIKEECDK
jgi:hypothetical protein